ncbi:recombinase family protein [Yoonia sp. R78084]
MPLLQSPPQIAAELNARGIKTARGGKWYATTVRNILTAENGAEGCAA